MLLLASTGPPQYILRQRRHTFDRGRIICVFCTPFRRAPADIFPMVSRSSGSQIGMTLRRKRSDGGGRTKYVNWGIK